MKNLVILTGPSGSGISSARFVFEELGYYIVEGCPSESVASILDAFKKGTYREGNFCIICQINDARKIIPIVKADAEFKSRVITLITDKKELLKRYALTRHAHPRSIVQKMSLEKAIDLDIQDANELHEISEITLDTTALTTRELRRQLYAFFDESEKKQQLTVTFTSFGIKNGIPNGIDMFFDVRSLPNPYWIANLKDLTGKDKKVIDYIMSFTETTVFLKSLTDFLEQHLKSVKSKDRVTYNIGIACSGGQHRSVFVSEYLTKYFKKEYKTLVTHRDSPLLNEK